ncbi:MAG: glutamate--tRNA ligase [Sedimentisphaerales bacterium]|nr:glutamate--tRNA ligase [Sedimentisphaerales bacterium]MBN2841907.1 glutamate--tRNA ligase [Sedimentisphaerales bacterium]
MVVTRFAPSPTGYLHIGGARTALFCLLMARHNGGKFLLRIEDTDQKRNTPTATQQVMDDLRWLGIIWDEGPDCGGPNGPYKQSERLEIYNRYIQQLIDTGKAYYCFDTTEELQEMREEAQAQKRQFLYRRPETLPTAQEAAQARAEGRDVVVRMIMPDSDIVVNDLVRGEVVFPAGTFSDFVIQKSDGFPTYHLACVVDDELMQVTHIVRGQEHLMNTPSHQVLQDALGFRRPTYAHMSVTVSEGGGKLSKRERSKTLAKAIIDNPALDKASLAAAGELTLEQLEDYLSGNSTPDSPQITAMAEHIGLHLPEINVVDFKAAGYLPEALVNFIALLGWSSPTGQEIMTFDELIKNFDSSRFNKTNSLFDRKKLASFNTEHMKMVSKDKLLGYFKEFLALRDSAMAKFDDNMLAEILRVSEGARTLEDVENKCAFLLISADNMAFDPKAVQKVLLKDSADVILEEVKARFIALADWNKTDLHKVIEDMCTERQLGMGKVAQPIRVAITGTTVSPAIDESLVLLGRAESIKRIAKTIEYVRSVR